MIIEGARQVGKTWLMKEFGKECYEKTVYINSDSNRQMKDQSFQIIDFSWFFDKKYLFKSNRQINHRIALRPENVRKYK